MGLPLGALLLKAFPGFMVKSFWARRGKHYADQAMSEAYRLMYGRLADLCLDEKPRKVLEYGCGYGYLLGEIHRKNALTQRLEIEYHGADYSRAQIENAKKHFPGGSFSVFDLTQSNPAWSENEFGVVVGVSVLMYIQPRQIKAALSELFRVCGGKLFLVEYYYERLSPQQQKSYRAAKRADGRCIYDYKALLEETGFRNVEILSFESFEDPSINTQGEMPQTLVVAEK